MTDLKDLYAELGRLLVQAEILGTASIPAQGQIGLIKQQIFEQLKTTAQKPESQKEPVKPKEDKPE